MAGSANQVVYKDGTNAPAGSANLTFNGTDLSVGGKVQSLYSSGDEGGELFLSKSVTNTTINNGVTVDIWQNRLRFFEQGGNARGYYLDIASGADGVGSQIATLSSPSFTGTMKVEQILEKATILGSAFSATQDYDLLANGSVLYVTAAAANNYTLNIRGNSTTTLNSIMSTGQSLTVAILLTNTGTAYYQTGFQIDGTSVSPKWQGGTAPTSGNTNSIDIYSITIIKTADATFTAFASQTKFA